MGFLDLDLWEIIWKGGFWKIWKDDTFRNYEWKAKV